MALSGVGGGVGVPDFAWRSLLGCSMGSPSLKPIGPVVREQWPFFAASLCSIRFQGRITGVLVHGEGRGAGRIVRNRTVGGPVGRSFQEQFIGKSSLKLAGILETGLC